MTTSPPPPTPPPPPPSPSGPLGPEDLEALDAYLDDRMDEAARAAFESRLVREPRLQREVQAHRAVESGLRAVFVPPAMPTGRRERDVAGRIGPWRRWRLVAMIALCVLGAGGYFGWQKWWIGPAGPLLAEYDLQVDNGFVPEVVCTTPEAFASWTSDALGTNIEPSDLDARVQLVGWARRDTLSAYTGVLLAIVDGQQVIVTMDPAELIKTQAARAGLERGHGSLRVFSTRLGKLMLHEVTPLGEPRIVPRLRLGAVQP